MLDIVQKRKEKNLTLEALGKKVGVSKSTIKKWESGYIKNMRRDKIAALAAALDVSPLEILDIPVSSVSAEKISRPCNDELKGFLEKFFDVSVSKTTVLYCVDNSVVCRELSDTDYKLFLEICEPDISE